MTGSKQEEALLAEISSLLLSQKKNLEGYCLVLQSMENAIASHDEEKINEYTAIDRAYSEKFTSTWKTIKSYRKLLSEIPVNPGNPDASDSASASIATSTIAEKLDLQLSLSQIENDIQTLKEKALELQEKNRERLAAEMSLLKNEMLLVRKSIQERKRFPTSFSDEPRYIDIKS
ncbi:MAG: hypothetical protein EHM28_13920 [Spirochaetaceae bacterium]|nr:MAG: hypothetical protein EHM28_13920 [Spirochaetaceae bacterium]